MKLSLKKDQCPHLNISLKDSAGNSGIVFYVRVCSDCGSYPARPHYELIDDPVTKKIRDKLNQEFIEFKFGKRVRNIIKKRCAKKYIPMHSDEQYMQFVLNHNPIFSEVHEQDKNFPYCYTMFTVLTQAIYGDSKKQLLDIGILTENFKLNPTPEPEHGQPM